MNLDLYVSVPDTSQDSSLAIITRGIINCTSTGTSLVPSRPLGKTLTHWKYSNACILTQLRCKIIS